MPDVTIKAVNLAVRLRQAAEELMTAIESIRNLKDEKEGSGIDFTAVAVEAAIAADDRLTHCSGNSFNSIISSGVAVDTFMIAGFHDDVFDGARL